ncbi:MAG: hypothetical protein JW822_00170 [Spirochaetales bacterium]|nr:hypothetical protein [Spirochaetales bacterium]
MLLRKINLLLIFTFFFLGCGEQAEIADISRGAHNIEIITVFSPALEDNQVGDSPYNLVHVLLPPDYQNSGKHYPVIYYLNGFDAPVVAYKLFESGLVEARDKNGNAFIFVSISGLNKYRGSFYANSPVTGKWEDFIVKELVSLIDKRYRTLAKSEARGLAGFSMGGMGALNLGLRHPDVFSVVYSLDPAIFNRELIKEAVADWHAVDSGIIIEAYSAVFSGDGSYPLFDGTVEDERIISQWQEGAGNWDQKIEAYLRNGKPLKALHIACCEQTEHPWIKKGGKHLSDFLNTRNIEHEFSVFDINHVITSDMVSGSMIPFFIAHLSFE